MICFPNAKINIGLRIIEKRADGFHNIESVFYPIKGLYDSLEWIESNKISFDISGLKIDGPIENNLCVKAWQLLHNKFNIPPIHIHLHKNIPFGAGLGGGSADAAFMLTTLNEYFELNCSTNDLEKIALTLGSDCPFFIKNKTAFAEKQGEVFSNININLSDYWLVLANPNIHVSTKEAYAGVTPKKRNTTLLYDFPNDILSWKDSVINDFEDSVFKNYPKIKELKDLFYSSNAIYASMSGSGSTVFGIFETKPNFNTNIPIIWEGKL